MEWSARYAKRGTQGAKQCKKYTTICVFKERIHICYVQAIFAENKTKQKTGHCTVSMSRTR